MFTFGDVRNFTPIPVFTGNESSNQKISSSKDLGLIWKNKSQPVATLLISAEKGQMLIFIEYDLIF